MLMKICVVPAGAPAVSNLREARAPANIMVPAPMVNIDNVLATKQYYSQKLIFHTLI